MKTRELTYEESKQIITDSMDCEFYKELEDDAPNISILFDMMLTGIECAICNSEKADKILQGGDLATLTDIIIKLPYYLLAETYKGVEDFAIAVVSLSENYLRIYYPDSNIFNTLDVVNKVFALEGNFTKMIISSQVLLTRMNKLVGDTINEVGISRQFWSTIMGEHIDLLPKNV